MANEVIECLKTRRSIRKYKDEQVAEDQLQQILDAAVYAPTGAGAQSPVIVLADQTKAPSWKEDAALVAGNILNAAHAVGVDSCYIFRAKEMFESDEGKELLKEWGLDANNYVGVANCILGYRDCEMPEPKPRKEDYIIRR